MKAAEITDHQMTEDKPERIFTLAILK